MKDLEERIKRLALWMFDAKYLVVFTGAGSAQNQGSRISEDRMASGQGRKRASTKTRPFTSVEPMPVIEPLSNSKIG